jgi:hypothetical protein
MGGTAYNFSARSARTEVYKRQSINDTFEQNKIGKMHESMDPKKALLREARDSEVHPMSFPIILGLDVTGSMGYIPHHIIQDGLPNLVSLIHEKGLKDPAILFMGIGDSRGDKAPLQVGQFESGDSELDMWLTRTWLEGGGWGNNGESYAWAWWFAANRCKTDHYEKRGKRGFIFTIGDDNCHPINSSEFTEVLGIEHPSITAEELYQAARKEWHIYHFCLSQNAGCDWWKKFCGEHAIAVSNYKDIPALIADIIIKHSDDEQTTITATPAATLTSEPVVDVKITL